MKQIVLSDGSVCVVSDEDHIFLAGWSWYKTKSGYAARSTESKGVHRNVYLHNVVAERMGLIGKIDHKDRVRLNNQRFNLRLATMSQNIANSSVRSNNTSGFVGVHWYNKGQKWHAQITHNYKKIHLGYFDSLIEAVKAYNAASIHYFVNLLLLTRSNMSKREFLQLAHTYVDGKHGIGSWFYSEKLDGVRCFWDGGITRGMFADQIPFANTAKDARLLVRPVSTGLWSRYGKVIHAPDWWLDQLPKDILLDGELWAGRGQFQTLVSITKKLTGGGEWQEVGYVVFDSPPAHVIFGDGTMDNTNFKKVFSGVLSALGSPALQKAPAFEFEQVYNWIRNRVPENEVVWIHEQTQLPWQTSQATSVLYDALGAVTGAGGEGIILKAPHGRWVPERTRTMLKLKFTADAEATVTGYTWGRETDKGSKLLGLMGALVLDFRGKRFELSGFTEEERKLHYGNEPYDRSFAIESSKPGEPVVSPWHNQAFPIGAKVTFKYRELTDGGIPKEARYWRKA